MTSFCIAAAVSIQGLAALATGPEQAASENGERTRELITFCLNYADGWLKQADPATGLLPRRLNQDHFWNAKDCAADNFPYLLLTARVTGQTHLERAAMAIFEAEKRLTPRIGSLPDTYDFAKGGFLTETPVLADILFGASEYAKDGLMPISEWLGPGPWTDRMQEMVRDIWAQAKVDTGKVILPSENVEILGNLMQVMSRLYWMTREPSYKAWGYRIADHYLLHHELLGMDRIALRDHGCEVLGGLSEVYLIASREDPDKRAAYRAPLHRVIDLILEKGRNEDGMMPNGFDVVTGEQGWEQTNDSWGYVYDAIYTVGVTDDEAAYRSAAEKAVTSVHKYLGADWERGSADGYADSIESALNLLNRMPCARGFSWVEQSVPFILAKQRPDGILEGWYGDGNSARTLMMYTMWLTQGVTASPWRKDMRIGAVPDGAGGLVIRAGAEWGWTGELRFDRPRHRDYFHMPMDYPRINQFPEWYTVEGDGAYLLSVGDGAARRVSGAELRHLPVSLEPGTEITIRLRPAESSPAPVRAEACSGAWREMRFHGGDGAAVSAWQNDLRARLLSVLRLDYPGPAQGPGAPPPRATVERETDAGSYVRRDLILETESGAQVAAILTLPKESAGRRAAVLCIPGHATENEKLFTGDERYKGYAAALASRGFVTLTVNVGRHEARDAARRTLMGERLFDLIRSVDYLQSLSEVDGNRIGCAGLSLGGEMCMWLAAVDTRVLATLSAGFLTYMNQMERDHCLCWKEAGLRETADFPDIYGLVAPRRLDCQIGEKEPRNQFNPVLARRAFEEIAPVYRALDAVDRARLVIHGGAHEIDLDDLLLFFGGALADGTETGAKQ